MVTSLPFALRLLLTVGLFLPINYFSLQNYQVVLRSQLTKWQLLWLAIGWFFLTILAAVILPEKLSPFVILLTPCIFAFYFKKYDGSLTYFTNLIVMLFLNLFHLAAFFIGDVFSYYLALQTKESIFIYIGLVINLLLVYGMLLLLSKTNLATFFYESFTDTASRLLASIFTLCLIVIWFGFIVFYHDIFNQHSQFSEQVFKSKSALAFFITGVMAALVILMVSLMYLKLIRSKLSLKEELVEQQNAYLFLLKEVQADIELFRVNSQHVLPTIQTQLEHGQIMTTTNLLSEQLASLEEETSLNFQQLNAIRHIQSVEIKNLLISTIFYLQKKAIPFYFDISEKIPSLLMAAQDTLSCSRLILANVCQAVNQEATSSVSLKVTQMGNVITFTLAYSLNAPPTAEGSSDYHKVIAKYPHVSNLSYATKHTFHYIFSVDLARTYKNSTFGGAL